MEESKETPFIKSKVGAIFGCINGIILYDLFWPYLVIIFMQLILQDNYKTLVDTKYNTMSLILMILTILLTLVAAIFIAKPKVLIKAYKKFEDGNIKLIFSCLGLMFLFSYAYNFILVLFGVDITGGNANQSNVVDLISEAPVLAAICMIILAPLLEEITYRYFLFGGIARYDRKWAIIISGFIFMCVHAIASFTQEVDSIARELVLLPPYMFSGMVLAYSYDKSENLLVSTSIHALNNLFSFILCLI